MRWFCVLIVTLLCVSAIPPASASGDGVHWNGYNLDRESIPNRVLVDMDGNNYSLHTVNADVTVVAFIFTTCVDVCPVITNNLLTAASQLEDVDYEFISITVDPATDSPEVLKAYMEDSGATWPHLTGELEDLELVWDDFQIEVDTTVIHSHDHSEDNESEHDDHSGHDNHSDDTENEHDGHDEDGHDDHSGHDNHSDDTENEHEGHDEDGHDDHSGHDNHSEDNESEHDGHDEDEHDNHSGHDDHSDDDAEQETEEDDSSNGTTTSTSHSTQTFILDEDWNPMVVFLGYDWNVDSFVEDVERAAHSANNPGDDSGLPGFTFATVGASLGLAIIAARREE